MAFQCPSCQSDKSLCIIHHPIPGNMKHAVLATIDSCGQWNGQEQEAVECWNRYVAPALLGLYARRADETGDDGGITDSVQSLAWERFCDSNEEESWDELGLRVQSFVNSGD